METFTNEDLLNKLSNKELVYKYMIIIEKIKNKSEEEKSLEEKEISNFIKNLEQDRNLFICLHIDKQFDGKPKTVFRENYIKDLTDKLDSYIESQKQKVPELNLDFDGKLSELKENIIKNKQYPKKYRECLLDYYKTDVELENEKNKEDIDKDRLKIIFYQKKIAFLDKYLDKLDIYKNLDINKNIHNSEDFDNTLKKMDLEIELLYYDYSIYSKLMKIRDLYNSYPINKNKINRQRQYLFTKRKYYLELNKKLNENYMFQELRNDNSLDLQQKKYELAKIKQQQRNLSTKRKKLANLTQNKVKNSPKSFIEKYNLKRSHSQPNLSFLEREKLKKYEKAIQIIKFNNSI